MISSQYPNLLSKAPYPLDQLHQLDREVEVFRNFISENDLSPSAGTDLLRFLTYSHLANKRTSTFALPNGSRTLFVAMSGPIVSYFLGRRRGLSQASQPKAEIYELVRRRTGKSYSALTESDKPPFGLRTIRKRRGDPLLMANMSYLDPDASLILDRISQPEVRSYVQEIYRTVDRTCRPDDENVTLYAQSRARQILNLELIVSDALSEPERGPREAGSAPRRNGDRRSAPASIWARSMARLRALSGVSAASSRRHPN